MKAFEERMITEENRVFSLDLLRAISCLLVVGVHFVQRFPIPGIIGVFFEKGSTGVSFFFILSGFFAYKSLERSDRTVNYLIKRAVHILPLYYMAILFYFVIYSVTDNIPSDSSGIYWLRYLLFINLWIPADNDFWINLGALWSISVFVLFYLLAPLLYRIMCKYYYSVVVVVVSYLMFKATEDVGTGRIPIRYLFYFVLGMMLYLTIKEGKESSLLSVMCLFILFCFLTDTGEAIVPPLLASIFILATLGNKESLPERGILKKIVCFIAKISYSIYIIHIAVFNLLDIVQIGNGVIYIIVFLVLTFGLSILSYNMIERKLSYKLFRCFLR